MTFVCCCEKNSSSLWYGERGTLDGCNDGARRTGPQRVQTALSATALTCCAACTLESHLSLSSGDPFVVVVEWWSGLRSGVG